MSTLKEKYLKEVVPKLKEELKIDNLMAIPKPMKVVVNMGFGIADKDAVSARAEELSAITGQKAVLTKARKSISNFKLREGMIVGAKVTLRGNRMYEFLDRLINAALPRIRDFRGLPADSFDSNGNYTVGLKEQTIFPEIDLDKVNVPQGMDITIVISSENKKASKAMLRLMGMPFADKNKEVKVG